MEKAETRNVRLSLASAGASNVHLVRADGWKEGNNPARQKAIS